MATVLVDARNVLRSQWPNVPEDELVRRCCAWADRHGHDIVLVFDGDAPAAVAEEGCVVVGSGGESADDWLIREAPNYRGAWLVTSDRALREAVGTDAARTVGGGAFLQELEK
jgi:uncharacterized protein YaiI (UPF0178 family)